MKVHKTNRTQLPLLPYKQQKSQNELTYVYPPGDDTYFLLRILYEQLSTFRKNPTILQIGSGSGIISANISEWLKITNPPTLQISIDINPDASQSSQAYYEQYAPNILQINTSIIKNTRLLSIAPDIVIFNPPYIPVSIEQQNHQKQYLQKKFKHLRQFANTQRIRQHNIIAYSYMGGVDGLQVTRQFLHALIWPCIAYFIVMGSQYTKMMIEEINNKIYKNLQPKVLILGNQQFHNEDLFVIKLILINQNQQNK